MGIIAKTLCAHGALPNEQDDYEFYTLREAVEAVRDLGFALTIPAEFERRPATSRVRGSRLVLTFGREQNDSASLPGWLRHRTRKVWMRVFDGLKAEGDWDERVRALVRCGSADGWAAQTESGWSRQPAGNVKMLLQHAGLNKATAEAVMGGAVLRSWEVVAKHFQPEYPGGREWNLDGAQLAFDPAPGSHPHWDIMLSHLGESLTPAIEPLPWFAKHGITTGGQYLTAWIASMFQFPYERLPYLFAYGSENCGKSIFHEAISLLVTKGVVNADRALSSRAGDFNGSYPARCFALLKSAT